MQNSNGLKLSVILITPDSYETLRRTLHNLRLQNRKSEMEIVIVTASKQNLQEDVTELAEFGAYKIVEVPQLRSIGSAYAAGIRQANAPVVALAEDHSFPQAGWAESLIRAHQNPCAAVGPAVSNANPNSLVSWADLLMAYSPWLEPTQGGAVSHLPGHNSSYKRAILLQYGSELEGMLEAESVLHWDLQNNGHLLYIEPSARTLHTNFGLLSSLISAHFHSGRQFGASRADNQNWSLLRRLFYSAAAPLVPPLRLWRISGDVRRLQKRPSFLFGLIPVLTLGLAVDALGECFGYLFGAGRSTEKLIALEFHRNQHQKIKTA